MKHVIKVERNIEVVKIALTGKMRSGKDEIGRHLWLHHDFDQLAFGDALKRTAHDVFPWVTSTTVGKPRALYQQYGQLMREIDANVWVKHVEKRINLSMELQIQHGLKRCGFVITDLRQPNEYEWAKANGFTIVKVTAPDELRLARAQAAGDDFALADLDHETESHIDSFAVDYEIVNDGDLSDLWRKVDEVLAEINAE
jgi:dephospho-CoA kinase